MTNSLELLRHGLEPQMKIVTERLTLLLSHSMQGLQGSIESFGNEIPVVFNVCRRFLHLKHIAQARNHTQIDRAREAQGHL